ncbi:MAG: thiamine pyrophosphate-binding protein [Chloroflexi bacterium]|nr:thiamine pyrophosphate-binding protein [Chloroflexota bacterium]
MSTINGAVLLARALAAAEVGPIFTLSGNQVLPVYDAGIDAGLRFVDGRHETAVTNMADAWGRLTGKPGVALVTAGPGHTNAMTGVATAWMAESPLILLSGGSNLAQAGKGGFQEIDQVGIIRPICKAAWVATSPTELPALVARAHRTALDGTPGPVHITLPFDILQATLDDAETALPAPSDYLPAPQRADDAAITQAVAMLAEARRPLILASPAASRGAAAEHLRQVYEVAGIPAFVVESPRGLTDPSLHGLAPEFRKADVVVLACPQDFTVGFAGPGVLGTARLIQIAPSQGAIGKNRPVAIGLVGDAATVLGQLAKVAGSRTWRTSGWRDELDSAHAENLRRMAPNETTDETPIHPLRVAATVRDRLDDGDSVALDGGEFGQWARWAIGNGRFATVGNGKLGGIGPGIPFAIGAKLARPERRAVAFVGDGTFGFHGLELDTAVRFGIPMVVVVGNDAGWAAERHRQRELYGPERVIAADLLPTRYDKVAEALGCHGEHVERPEELRPALERAFASRKPACVDVTIASIPSPSATH